MYLRVIILHPALPSPELPHLDTLTGEERARLERRLMDESNKMHNAFATLAYKTMNSLLTHNYISGSS